MNNMVFKNNDVLMKANFTVSYDYKVLFTDYIFNSQNTLLSNLLTEGAYASKCIIFIDGGLVDRSPNLIRSINNYFKRTAGLEGVLCCEPVVLEGGEKIKNSKDGIDQALEKINENNLCRQSYVIAIGGGAFLDAIGLASTLAHRGIKHIRIPTTVLSQNDSGVGVKNGINQFDKKNFIGTFSPPYAVVIDNQFLTTLSDSMWISGCSEAVKVALLKDAKFFDFLKQNANEIKNRNMPLIKKLIMKCAELHLNHITQSEDAFENSNSRPLDFGHWAAHKIEHISNYEINHGRAVGIGLALDSTYSFITGALGENELNEILNCLKDLGLEIIWSEYNGILETKGCEAELFKGLDEFQEHIGGELSIPLLNGIAEPFETSSIDKNKMVEAIEYLMKREKGLS
jgi:3-dehydroquinate synthase